MHKVTAYLILSSTFTVILYAGCVILLPNYLSTVDKNKRINWLRQLELEALQYRLMHKGYSRFYPLNAMAETTKTQNSFLIDSESAFWDSGYRRLATKLFISRVFLPAIEEIKKGSR